MFTGIGLTLLDQRSWAPKFSAIKVATNVVVDPITAAVDLSKERVAFTLHCFEFCVTANKKYIDILFLDNWLNDLYKIIITFSISHIFRKLGHVIENIFILMYLI